MFDTICIAGKNNIAVNIAKFIGEAYPKCKIIGVPNSNDTGVNTWQQSFKKFCQLGNIPLCTLEEIYPIRNLLFLSLEFDKIVDPRKFKTNEIFNIHFSYLPEYKGMYTSALPILHGKSYSGVTLHKIDRGIDTGNIIAQKKFDIGWETTAEELYSKYISYGTDLIKEHFGALLKKNYTERTQEILNSTYFSKKTINYKELSVDLNCTAWDIYNQIRAFAFPAYQLPTVMGHNIYASQILHEKSLEKPGTVLSDGPFELKLATVDFNIILYKDRRDELFSAFRNGDLNFIKNLRHNNYPIHQRSKEGWDGLILSAYNGHFESLKYLIEELDWDQNTSNNNGTTFAMYAMTHASKTGDLYILNYIMQRCAKVDWAKKDYNNRDIYFYAIQYGNKEVKNLIKK